RPLLSLAWPPSAHRLSSIAASSRHAQPTSSICSQSDRRSPRCSATTPSCATRRGRVGRANSRPVGLKGDSLGDSPVIHSLKREGQAGRRSGIGEQRMQTMYGFINGALRQLDLPDPDEMVIPGIRWGAFDELLTPAYW